MDDYNELADENTASNENLSDNSEPDGPIDDQVDNLQSWKINNDVMNVITQSSEHRFE